MFHISGILSMKSLSSEAQFTIDQLKIWPLQLPDSSKKECIMEEPILEVQREALSLLQAMIMMFLLMNMVCLGSQSYDHLMELHKAIKLSERALVNADPTVTPLRNYEQAHVFSSMSGGCAVFSRKFPFEFTCHSDIQSGHYELPPWSISILSDCKTAVFNCWHLLTDLRSFRRTISIFPLYSCYIFMFVSGY